MKIKKTTILLLFLALMFISDGANTILTYYDFPFNRSSIFVRALAEGYCIWLLVLMRKSDYILVLLFFFYSILAIGTAMSGEFYQIYDIVDSGVRINKLLLVFIFWETFRQYVKEPGERHRLFALFETIVLVQICIVFLSFIFDWQIFAPYGSRRFGYAGFISAQNEVAGFYLIAFFYFLWKVTYFSKGHALLIATLVAGLLSGTRITLLLPVILMLYGMWAVVKRGPSKTARSVVILVTLLVVVGWWQRDYLLSRIAPSVAYFAYHAPKIGLESPGGWLIASSRWYGENSKFSTFVYLLSEFDLATYLFGGKSLSHTSFEVDPLDMFVRLGLIGSGVFYVLYLRLLLPSWSSFSFIRLLFVVTWLSVSVVAGHLVFSAINGIYLAILLHAFASVEHLGEYTSPPRREAFSRKRRHGEGASMGRFVPRKRYAKQG